MDRAFLLWFTIASPGPPKSAMRIQPYGWQHSTVVAADSWQGFPEAAAVYSSLIAPNYTGVLKRRESDD